MAFEVVFKLESGAEVVKYYKLVELKIYLDKLRKAGSKVGSALPVTPWLLRMAFESLPEGVVVKSATIDEANKLRVV